MNIFVAGATGVLGRRLVRRLTERGHQVTGLVRNRDGERLVAGLGGTPRFADLFDAGALVHAADGADVVIHAATAIPSNVRLQLRDWELNDRIRTEGTRALAECAARIGARQFLFQSIVWAVRPADDGPFDESAPPNGERVMQSATEGERIVQEAAARAGFTASVLRCGLFYAADATHTRMMVDGLRKRRMPLVGSGDALWCVLHADDAADAFVTVAESGRSGLWHVVDDQPVSVAEYLNAFADRLGARPPRHLPHWLARLLLGRFSYEFFTRPTRTTAERFKHELGWQPRYPTYREGAGQIVEQWSNRT